MKQLEKLDVGIIVDGKTEKFETIENEKKCLEEIGKWNKKEKENKEEYEKPDTGIDIWREEIKKKKKTKRK